MRSFAYLVVAPRPQPAGLRESPVVTQGYNSYDVHHCRRQPPALLTLGIDRIGCRAMTLKNGNPAVRTGITRLANALVSASVVFTAAIICAGAAVADSQQDQFVAQLEQLQIPPVDNVPALVTRAHQICGELDGGSPVDAVINDEMNTAFGDSPSLHLYPGRVQRTAARFVTASVNVYCPRHQGELPPT
jgi:hypothetical protein